MSIFNEIIQAKRVSDLIEDAAAGATSAGAVAGVRAPLGAKTVGKKKKKRKMQRRAMPTGAVFAMRFEGIEDETFDSADVISKLKSAETKADNEEDSTGFALEDEDGKIVKVYVAADQAKDFESALGTALAGEDEDDEEAGDDENTSLEIAEVLFGLKDRFTIIDVEWPDIEEDEEEEDISVEGGEGDVEGGDAEGNLDPDVEGGEDEDGMEAELQAGEDGELGDEMGMGEDPAASALDKVIDLLKAQADAQTAEANAKEAEANAEEAKHNASAAEAKVKQEEEVLDMEAYYDDQKKLDKEAKQLSKLAKYKHETAQSADNELKGDAGEFKMPEKDDVPNEDNEQNVFHHGNIDKNRNRKLEPGEFIKYMFKSVQRGN
jgi:negative regulator of replication initiation